MRGQGPSSNARGRRRRPGRCRPVASGTWPTTSSVDGDTTPNARCRPARPTAADEELVPVQQPSSTASPYVYQERSERALATLRDGPAAARRHADRRHRRPGPTGRRRGRRRPHRRGRPHPASSTPDAGTEVVDLDGLVLAPGLHRHPHPLRRPDPLGRRPHPVELARRHERRDGQLRLRRGADPARAPRHRSCARSRTSRACRWRPSTPASTGASRRSPSTCAAHRRAAQAPQRRRLRRPLAAAAVRARRRGAAGHRRRGRRDARPRPRGASQAGAIGFSTSRQPAHQGAYGRPVPSRFAEVDEVVRARRGARRAGQGRRSQVSIGPGPVRRPVLRAGGRARRARHVDRARRPGRQARRRAAHRRAGRGAARRGVPADRLPPDRDADRPWPTPCRSAEIDVWKEVLALPRDERAGAVPRRRRGATGPAPTTLDAWSHRWSKIERRGDRRAPRRSSASRSTELAAERGTTPFDLMLDLALDRRAWPPASASSWTTTATTRSATCSPTSARCSACPTPAPTPASSATPATRPTCSATGCASARRSRLEDAVWRLTGHPHQAFRIAERGLVQEGFLADLVAFDPDTVGCTPGRAGARPARRRRPARRPQHRRRAHLGQRRGHPPRRRRTSPAPPRPPPPQLTPASSRSAAPRFAKHSCRYRAHPCRETGDAQQASAFRGTFVRDIARICVANAAVDRARHRCLRMNRVMPHANVHDAPHVDGEALVNGPAGAPR